MIDVLWFLIQKDEVVGVFDDHDIAEEEREFLAGEEGESDVRLRKMSLAKLKPYTAEYEMAEERGYFFTAE